MRARDRDVAPIGIFEQHGGVESRGEVRGQSLRASADARDARETFSKIDERVDAEFGVATGRHERAIDHANPWSNESESRAPRSLRLGFLVFLSALAAIFVPVFRRIVLYALVIQILVGFGLWFGAHYPAPKPAHWILALLVGGLYAAASAAQKRGRTTLPYTIPGAIVIAFVFYLGQHQVMHP